MKKTILILVLLLSYQNYSYSQTELNFFANKLCDSFKESDLQKPKDDLFGLLQKNSNELYNKNPEELASVTNKFKEKNPNKSDREIALLVGNEVALLAIKNCPIFQKISQKIAVPESKKDKQSVLNVRNELCNLLNNSSDKSNSNLEKILQENFFDLLFKNKELIEKEYGTFGSDEYNKELNISLMNDCDIYYKMTMAKQ